MFVGWPRIFSLHKLALTSFYLFSSHPKHSVDNKNLVQKKYWSFYIAYHKLQVYIDSFFFVLGWIKKANNASYLNES